ncbi:MAG: hypothetical protein M3143_05550 [Actinomycetota bacterium]|nr:hypothetical protein [Actinomycetota bacterium]
MTEIRATSHAEFRSRRVRLAATVTISVVVESVVEFGPPAPKRKRAGVGQRRNVPAGLTEPGVKWDVLPERIRPEDWVTEQADPAVPGSVMLAETQREWFYPT